MTEFINTSLATMDLGHLLLLLLLLPSIFLKPFIVTCVEILSKSKLESCVKTSESGNMHCDKKIVVNLAVPSGSSGGESSIVAELVEVEENSTQQMRTIREPPVITINKSAAYALYEILYIRDVAYKPEELFVKTRKCEPSASYKVVNKCERLRDESGNIIEYSQPHCCPCGPQRRVPSSCGNVFDKIIKGKANTAHCLRFQDDWFHVFSVGRRSIGFSIRIKIKKGSKISEVIVGPENRTVLSNDTFLRVNLIGDYAGYSSIPSFEDLYLVIPRQGNNGLSQDLGNDFSRWMLLERVRFGLDGLECDKIGVSFEAYNGQPNFCGMPFMSCLHNQLWNFWEADQNRIRRNQTVQYVVDGRFERINQHPNAGIHSFSIGITEVLNTNIMIELSADDVHYVYQRSPGKILSIVVPAFEALTQFGVATIVSKNTGKLEASYSLTFKCSSGVSYMEEQFFIMKPEAVCARSFKLYTTTDQAANYKCTATLKASDFTEVSRAMCQFTTTSTILDNGTQIIPTYGPETHYGFFETVKNIFSSILNGLVDFFIGRSCRNRCSGLFDFSCHIQYICVSWIVMVILLLAIFPTVMVLVWLLHQKGFFDPLYDWWDDHYKSGNKHHHHSHPKHRQHDEAVMRKGHYISSGHHKHQHSAKPRRGHGDHHNHDRYLNVNNQHHNKHRSRNNPAEQHGSNLNTDFEDYMRERAYDHHRHKKNALVLGTSHVKRNDDYKRRKHNKPKQDRIHEHAHSKH